MDKHRLLQRRAPRNDNGFTLLELMIVVAIIAILAAALVPNFIGFDTEARLASTKTNLNTLRTRLNLFRAKEGRYPKDLNELTTTTYSDLGVDKPYLDQVPSELISSSSGDNEITSQPSSDQIPGDGGWVYYIDKAKVIIDWDKELEKKWGKSEGQKPSDW